MDKFKDLFSKAAASPQFQQLASSPQFQYLAREASQKAMNDPRVQKAMSDPRMQQFTQAAMSDPRVQNALGGLRGVNAPAGMAQPAPAAGGMIAAQKQNMVAPPVFTANQPMIGSLEVCPPPKSEYTEDDLLAVYPNGVMTESLVPDQQTGRVSPSLLATYVRDLQGRENSPIPKHPEQHVVGDNTNSISVNEKVMEKVVESDASVFNRFGAEYCFYEQRYRYALKTFLQLATSRDTKTNPAAQRMLQHTKKLNLRLNSVLEVMNYLTQQRVTEANASKDSINKSNAEINKAIARLQNTYGKLSKDNAMLITQKEMVRYTQEKNSYTTNQISLWAALNVLALGTIFYVYRN